ncbi:MAG: glycosyltransferase, partial [Candidatus Hodarchaeota archaeon]
MLARRPNGKKLTVIHNYLPWLHLTENWIYNQVRYLPEEVETHIVCKSTINLDQFALPNIHCLAETPARTYICVLTHGLVKLRFSFRRHTAFLIWIANQKKATIMHSHFGYTGWTYMGAAKQAGMKHVVTFYGVDVNRLPKENPVWLKRYRKMFSSVDRVLCEGPHMADSIIKLGCPEQKVRIHHLGVRVDEIPYRPRQWKPTEPLRVFIAASFREKKGIPYALEALGRLKATIPLEITIVGDAGQNPAGRAEKEKIITTIEKYNLR